MDNRKYGPWALIAGGSEGLGASFGAQLAAAGFNLILLGRKAAELEETAAAVRSSGAEVRALSVDLSLPDAVSHIRAITDDVEVGLLIYNAGANSYGRRFLDGDLDGFRSVIDLNVHGRLALVHHFGNLMKSRRRGGIMLIGSMAGYRGSPHTSIYNATKAFGRTFSEGLWYECQPYGVDVVEFVVGAMRTPAMARRGMALGPWVAEPDVVAAEGLAHLLDGPVYNSQFGGGLDAARREMEFPRGPIIERAAAGLRASGLYPD